jgi:hypothetical protein
MVMVMIPYLSISQTSPLSLKPHLIKDASGNVTHYAFNKHQARYIIKMYERSVIDAEKIDTLENGMVHLRGEAQQYKDMRDSLALTNAKYRALVSGQSAVIEKEQRVNANLTTINLGLEQKVVRKNKRIKTLLLTNLATLLLIVVITN